MSVALRKSRKYPNVLLINPPHDIRSPSIPIGISYIAAVARKRGCETKIIDMAGLYSNYSREDVISMMRSFQPDLVGVGLIINGQMSSIYELARDIKQNFDGLLVAGGPHTSTLPEEPLSSGFDMVIRGEGEKTFEELIIRIKENESIESLPGISYRSRTGEYIHNIPNKPIENLDELPFPARDLLDLHCYLRPGEKYGSSPGMISSSRGCPNNCTFCSNPVFGRRVRLRSAENIFDEMVCLHEKYGIKSFQFVDDSFTVNKKRVFELCELLKKWNVGIKWRCVTRLDYLTKELLIEMKNVGCYAIELGVESANPGSLKRMKKNISIDRLMEVLVWTSEVGVLVSLFFMFGFPWERIEEARNTNNFMKKISGLVDRFSPGGVLIPYPGTEIYEEYKDSEGFEKWWLAGWLPKDFSPLHKLQPWYFFNYSDETKKVIKEGLDFIEKHNARRPLRHILRKIGIRG